MARLGEVWPAQVDVVLTDRFTLLSLSSAVEVLRVANRVAERPLFKWRLLSQDGKPVTASNGITLEVDGQVKDAKGAQVSIIFAGFHPDKAETPAILGYLRTQARHGVIMGGIETGPQLLAAAGLLDGHSASIHWEHFETFRQRFPQVEAVPVLFTMEERRFTCCGLMAVADLMIALMARWVSNELAGKVAETIVHHQRSADGTDSQRLDPVQRFNIHSEVLRQAIRIMQENLERPLSTKEIAEHCRIGVRQLERRFHQTVGATPAKFYLRLRQHFGVTPSGERRSGPTIGA